MKTITLAMLSAAMFSVAVGASAASENDYRANYAKASTAAAKSLDMNAGWTVTAATLKQAKEAAAAHDYDKAVTLAKHAEALAQASIRQSEQQQKMWQKAVVK